MYTLYVPSAGFLWSDGLMWAQETPDRHSNASDRPDKIIDASWVYDHSHRVYFEDRFAERLPWTIKPTKEFQAQTGKKKALRTGSVVYLVDSMAARYLCVIDGERVVSEAGWPRNEDDDDHAVDRSRVGSVSKDEPPCYNADQTVRTLPTPVSPSCAWTVHYDADRDNGIAFYSAEHSCTLATTFRSAPSTRRSNDTLSQALKLDLEASCTQNANRASSRIYLIDAMPSGPSTPSTPTARSLPVTKDLPARLYSCLLRAVQYFQARSQLAKFRRNHAGLQDTGPPSLLTEGRSSKLDFTSIEHLVIALFLSSFAALVSLHGLGNISTSPIGDDKKHSK
ncbi:hypothetical protein LTR17_002381 [Elasticomyces elasticus]|nr:hypothetical protein LTR17_002381 [Elasticomyces elasticus]